MQDNVRAKVSLEASATAKPTVIRGAETWQFWAFVFAATAALEMALLQGVPWYWLRALLLVVAFGVTFWITMLCRPARNWLAKQLHDRIKVER